MPRSTGGLKGVRRDVVANKVLFFLVLSWIRFESILKSGTPWRRVIKV